MPETGGSNGGGILAWTIVGAVGGVLAALFAGAALLWQSADLRDVVCRSTGLFCETFVTELRFFAQDMRPPPVAPAGGADEPLPPDWLFDPEESARATLLTAGDPAAACAALADFVAVPVSTGTSFRAGSDVWIFLWLRIHHRASSAPIPVEVDVHGRAPDPGLDWRARYDVLLGADREQDDFVCPLRVDSWFGTANWPTGAYGVRIELAPPFMARRGFVEAGFELQPAAGS